MRNKKHNKLHKYNRTLCSVALSSALAVVAVGSVLPVVAQASESTGVTTTTGRILYVGERETGGELHFQDLRAALGQAKSGDTIRLTSNVVYQEQQTEGLQINKDVTIDGQNNTLSIRASVGKGIDMHADLTLKNLTLSFTAEKADAVINVGGNSLTIDNVSTKISEQQKDERPTIIGGKSDKEGAHTRITIIGENKETRFREIYAGDGKSNTSNPVTINIQNVHTTVDKGIQLGGKDGHSTTGKVTVETKSQNIKAIYGNGSSDNSVKFTNVDISSDVNVPNVKNITLEGENTNLTLNFESLNSNTPSTRTLETLEVKDGANLKLGNKFSENETPLTVGTLKGDGTITISNSPLTVNGNVEGNTTIKVDSTVQDNDKTFVTVTGDVSGLTVQPMLEGSIYTFEREGNSFKQKNNNVDDTEDEIDDEEGSLGGNQDGTESAPEEGPVGEREEHPSDTPPAAPDTPPAGPKAPEENNTTVEPEAGTGSGENTGPGAGANSPSTGSESASTPGAAGESVGTPGAAGESAGTPDAEGESASTPGAAGESAGTPGAEGESASTPGAAGESAGTPSAGNESAATPSAGSESAGTSNASGESTGSSGNAGTVQPAKPVTPKPVEPVKPAPVKPEPPKAPKPAEKSIQERITDALKGLFTKAHLNKKQQQQAVEKTEESLSNLTRAYTDYDFSFSLDAARVTEDRLNDLTMFNDLESASIDNYAFLAQSAKALKNHNSVWVSSSLAEQRGDGDSKRRLSTINLGYDRQFDNLILGGFVSYLRQKGERGELSSKLHGYSFSLYGKYYQNAHEVIALLNTGRTKAELQRNISALGVSNQADAKGKFIGLRVEYGYRMPFETHNLQVKPLVGLSYNLGRQAAFTESGTMPVHVGKIKAQRLSLETGVELRKYFETAYVYVKPTIQTDLMARSNDVDILFVNSPNSIPFKSAIKKKTYFALSLGTQVQLRKNLLLDVNANSRIGNNERDIQGSVKLGYKF